QQPDSGPRRIVLHRERPLLYADLRRAYVQTRSLAVQEEVPYLSRFITLSAAVQCSSETHSRAKAATASVVVTPRITRLISRAGRFARERAILRDSASKESRAMTWSTSPLLWASCAVRTIPVP